jgi:hypothetical protein
MRPMPTRPMLANPMLTRMWAGPAWAGRMGPHLGINPQGPWLLAPVSCWGVVLIGLVGPETPPHPLKRPRSVHWPLGTWVESSAVITARGYPYGRPHGTR